MFTGPWLNLILFAATCASTYLVQGAAYACTMMSILVFHEMGHYLQARRYGVPASLPFFIPMPLIPFGTMGAVIRMGSLGADRKTLFDIGVTGPIAGLVIAIPATVWGLVNSQVVRLAAQDPNTIQLGESILLHGLTRLIFGELQPGYDVLLHPVAFAGWAGLFITALNLLPIGQLDGGHVAYALWGKKSHRVALGALILFALTAVLVNPAWTLMVLLVFLMGYRHPPTANDSTPLDRRRRWIGYAALAFLLLSFTPDPMRLG